MNCANIWLVPLYELFFCLARPFQCSVPPIVIPIPIPGDRKGRPYPGKQPRTAPGELAPKLPTSCHPERRRCAVVEGSSSLPLAPCPFSRTKVSLPHVIARAARGPWQSVSPFPSVSLSVRSLAPPASSRRDGHWPSALCFPQPGSCLAATDEGGALFRTQPSPPVAPTIGRRRVSLP